MKDYIRLSSKYKLEAKSVNEKWIHLIPVLAIVVILLTGFTVTF